MEILLLPLVVVALLLVPVFQMISKVGKTGTVPDKAYRKRAIITNLCGFFGVLALCVILPLGGISFAAGPEGGDPGLAAGLGYLAAALATGLGSIGCGIAVAAAAPAAIGATAEEPKSFVKSLIFVALGEGVAIYGILISILILNAI